MFFNGPISRHPFKTVFKTRCFKHCFKQTILHSILYPSANTEYQKVHNSLTNFFSTPDGPSYKWNVTRLGNGRYYITSRVDTDATLFASTGGASVVDAPVSVQAAAQEWVIKANGDYYKSVFRPGCESVV